MANKSGYMKCGYGSGGNSSTR